MAAEVSAPPTNGYGHQATPSTTSNAPVSSGAAQSDLSKEQVAWYFVESYYTTMSQTPEKLHLFFNKRSQLVSGVEEEKSSVAVGQKAIKEKLTDLKLVDTKVRVTNVDSQASDSNIIIQVIGELSNSAQPHRKFVQTFVLASQTNGYFVLNDIFRYIKEDDEDETEEKEVEAEPIATETVHVEASGTEEEVKDQIIEQVEKKLEEVKLDASTAETAEEAPAVNGTPEVDEPVVEAEDAPAAATETKAEEVEAEVAQEDIAEPEKPQDPLPTPKAEPQEPAPAPVAAAPSAPPKPAVPKSWAQLAAGNQAKAAAAAPKPAPSAPAQSQPQPAASAKPTPSAPAATTAAAREASPDSTQGSTGGWQTAGADHTRKQSRPANAPAQAQQGHDGRIRAFVKNVTEEVDADALKKELAKHGEIVYFDVARVKKAAFVEFATAKGFNAAVAASPIRVGSEEVWVEERRVAGGGFAPRGGRGGRGGFEGRGGAPRGGFGGRGGRGGQGSGNVTPRGGRGGAQA